MILYTIPAIGSHTVTGVYDLRPLLGEDATREDFGDLIVKMVSEVAPDDWRDHGGPIGDVTQRPQRRAVVTNTRENHRLLRQWLDARLAEVRASGGKPG